MEFQAVAESIRSVDSVQKCLLLPHFATTSYRPL
jgi:hypothetical protein